MLTSGKFYTMKFYFYFMHKIITHKYSVYKVYMTQKWILYLGPMPQLSVYIPNLKISGYKIADKEYSSQAVVVGGSLVSSRPAWATKWVPGKESYTEKSCLEKTKKKNIQIEGNIPKVVSPVINCFSLQTKC